MRYGKGGFRMLVSVPRNLLAGEPTQSDIVIVGIQKLD